MKKLSPHKLKKSMIWIGAAAIAMSLSTMNAYGDATNSPPEILTLNVQANHADLEGLPKDKKSVNNFSHRKHAEEYLKGNGGYGAQSFTDAFTCAACHLGATSREEVSGVAPKERLLKALNNKGGPEKLKEYFHGICQSCHKAMAKADKATGPTKCSGCHSR